MNYEVTWRIERDDGEVVQVFWDYRSARKVWDSDLYDRSEYRLVPHEL